MLGGKEHLMNNDGEELASDKQVKMMYALEKQLGRVPKWRQGVTASYARSLIDELIDEAKAAGIRIMSDEPKEFVTTDELIGQWYRSRGSGGWTGD
jgi:hypothetical protein